MSTLHRQRASADTKPTISAIIPVYNVASFIGEALESVFAQTFTAGSLLMMACPIRRIEEEIAKYRNSIVYFSQPNREAAAARNAGLCIARGEYVAFLDHDIWLPEFLQEQLKLITSDGGYDMVYSDAIYFGGSSNNHKTFMTYNPSRGIVTFKKLVCSECSVVTSTVVARREPILRIGCFDERFPNSQDFDLWLRLLRDANGRITYQKKVLVRRRMYGEVWRQIRSLHIPAN